MRALKCANGSVTASTMIDIGLYDFKETAGHRMLWIRTDVRRRSPNYEQLLDYT